MKTKYLAFATAFMLASCSNDEDFVSQDNLKDTPIAVTAGVANLNTRAGYETNKEDDTKSVLPETFYLTVVQTEEASQYNYYNMEMTKTTGENKYTTTDDMLWKDATRNPFVSAYTIEGTAFSVQNDQSTDVNVIASDLLGAIKESGETSDDVTITDDNIGISFRHLLCKLDVTFSWGTELATATTKTVKSVEYQGFGTNVTLDRDACTITKGETTADIKAYVSTADEGVTYLSEAIFAPQVGTAPKIVITALIDNVERVFSLNVTAPTDGFVSGKHYTMGVKIGGTVAEISRVSVASWTERPINDVESEEVPPTTFDATAMTASQLTSAMTKALKYGHTALTVNLAEDADATMFSAITAALATTVDPSLDWYDISSDWDIVQNTIDLTISGAKTVPENAFCFDEYMNENYYKAGATLKSVTLTDATEIGESAFNACGNLSSFSAPNAMTLSMSVLSSCYKLTDVNLPSVQSIGSQCFSDCVALKTISLPECTYMEGNVFWGCEALETFYGPQVTTIGFAAFQSCTTLTKVTFGAVVSVFQNTNEPTLFRYGNDTSNIELVLSSDQKVMIYDESTKYWNAGTEAFDFGNTNEFIGYTFKSISKQE